MSVICPTVTAYDLHEYRRQIDAVSDFAQRIHIDLMDGIFAPTKSPGLDQIWLPTKNKCDIHLMFQHPAHQLRRILRLDPHLVIVPAEADAASVDEFIKGIKKTKIRIGISLMPETDPDTRRVSELIKRVDHVLIFSGHLGYHGGTADLALLDKVKAITALQPQVEIGWDGGVNAASITSLAQGGVAMFAIGSAVQRAADPRVAYEQLQALI